MQVSKTGYEARPQEQYNSIIIAKVRFFSRLTLFAYKRSLFRKFMIIKSNLLWHSLTAETS